MQLDPEEVQENPAVEAFIAELRHWREVAGYSQKALAPLVGYTASYVSKVERGTILASRSFAESADQHLRAGRAVAEYGHAAGDAVPDPDRRGPLPRRSSAVEPALPRGPADLARGRTDRNVRRRAHDVAGEARPGCLQGGLASLRESRRPVPAVSGGNDVDRLLVSGQVPQVGVVVAARHPAADPQAEHDRRVPRQAATGRVGNHDIDGGRGVAIPHSYLASRPNDQVVFTWSTDEPPLHARYRIEWKFKAPDDADADEMETMTPAERMRSLEIASG